MTNEIALRDTDSWAPMLPAVNQLSKGIANTAFVPKALRGDEYAVAACVLTGRELGIGPMESLQKIYLVEGKPSLSSELMRSLVFRAGHSIRFTQHTDKAVTVEGKRQGDDSWTAVTWTMADAQRIGVANKPTWKGYPRAMLANRATSELCRLIFPDALGGLSYTPEELEDESYSEPVVTVSRATTTARVSRAKPAAPEPPEPPLDEPPVDVTDAEVIEDAVVVDEVPEPPTDEPDTITEPQMRKMRVLLTEVGMTNRDAILEYVGGVVGHEVGSSKALTKAEGSMVIEALTELASMVSVSMFTADA